MLKFYNRLRKWGNDFGNQHKWFSFVASIAFVGLALFRIGTSWDYILIAPLILLGILIVITIPTKADK